MTRKVFFCFCVEFGIFYQTNIKGDAWKSSSGPATCKGVLENVTRRVVSLTTSTKYTNDRREDDEEIK